MNLLSPRLLAAGLFLSCANPATAQTVAEIVEKHLAANGGRAALEKISSRSMTGTITLQLPVGEIRGSIEVLNQSPNKQRTLVKIDLAQAGGGTMVQDERFDGSTGYVIDTLQGNREMIGNQRENIRNEVFPSPFLNYAQRGDTLELTGTSKVGDREAYVLILRPKSGPAMRRYIDTESFLEIRTVQRTEAPQVGEFDLMWDLLDYRDVDGVKVPFVVRGSSTFQNFTVTISSVQHNLVIDQSLFSKPN